MATGFPRMMALRQKFPAHPLLDVRNELLAELEASGIAARLKPGSRVALGVGSRGITHLDRIVLTVVEFLKRAGAQPFIVPAMGSHGGATPEGQAGVLADYGITEKTMKAPVQSSMEVRRLGETAEGVEVFFSADALEADGIIPINRIKPHTDFSGEIGSGIQKMIAIGFAKRTGAVACHAAAAHRGHAPVITSVARFLLSRVPFLCGVAILENQVHATHRVVVLRPEELAQQEPALLDEARLLMPRLPFEDIDLLIVDRLGKDVSGAGMDPNIIGRGVQGYSAALDVNHKESLRIRRIFVRELTNTTHGNAIGIGMADVTTTRLVRAIDARATYINALSAVTPQTAKVPIHFDTDREALEQVLTSLCLPRGAAPRVVRILDTLSLEAMLASEAYGKEIRERSDLTLLGEPEEMQFDDVGNLTPLPTLAEKDSLSNRVAD